MEDFKWRVKVRIMAVVDLLVSLVVLFPTIQNIRLGLNTSNVALLSILEIEEKPFSWVVWTELIIMVLFVMYDMWAAVMMLIDTKQGTNLKVALRSARFWRNGNMTFLYCGIIFYVFTKQPVPLAIEIVCQGAVLYVVCQFIEELMAAIDPNYILPVSKPGRGTRWCRK